MNPDPSRTSPTYIRVLFAALLACALGIGAAPASASDTAAPGVEAPAPASAYLLEIEGMT